MNSIVQYQWLNRIGMPFCLLVFMFVSVLQTEAQGQSPEQPPRPIIVVRMAQQLNFGSIIPTGDSNSEGTVTITNDGMRSYSGYVLPLSSSLSSCAGFKVDAEPGTLITIEYNRVATLGGPGSLSLRLGEPNTGSPFITSEHSTIVYIGGTLTIGSIEDNPAGLYNTQFEVRFIQQ